VQPKYSRNDWRCELCWLHPRESSPEVEQIPGGAITSPTLLCPILVWSQQNYQSLLITPGCFES